MNKEESEQFTSISIFNDSMKNEKGTYCTIRIVVICNKHFKASDFPCTISVNNNRLGTYVSMQQLGVLVQKSQTLCDLHQTILDFHLEQLEVNKLLRLRKRHIVMLAKDVGQTTKAWLSGKRQTVLRLLELMLKAENSRMLNAG